MKKYQNLLMTVILPKRQSHTKLDSDRWKMKGEIEMTNIVYYVTVMT